jgi:hypothetical protein
MLREIRMAYDDNNLRRANKSIRRWEKQLASASTDLKRQYGIADNKAIRGSFLVKVYNSVAAFTQLPQFPEFEFNIPLPNFIQPKDTSFSTVYKDIAGELTAIERLGGIRDRLAAKFEIDDSEYVAPKTESPQYRWAASDWKRPM